MPKAFSYKGINSVKIDAVTPIMWFRTEANAFRFEGNLGDDVLPLTAALHNMVAKQGYLDIVLDFSNVGFLNPTTMIPLVTMARAYRSDNVNFEILMPKELKSEKLILNANWAHLIAPEHFERRDEQNLMHLSALQYTNADQHFDAVNRSLEVILKSTPGLDRKKIKALEWSLNEITDNVLNHAESHLGGILQVMSFPKKQIIDFYVCDAGMGIPRTLRLGRPELTDDVSALRAAIEEGVTRNKITNQGNGLYGTFRCCTVSGGEFEILSGNVELKHKKGSLRVKKNAIPFKGTFIRASINYGFEKLLDKALVFRGQSYDPGFDYVERIYQEKGEDIYFKVSTEVDSFGTREAGRGARTKIENLMDNFSVAVNFDFDGIHLISSSFADEVFGKLFVTLGPIKFSQLCKFNNLDKTVGSLIDRSISQRMRI